MSDDRVKELAKESDHVKARREDLKKETAKLKEALKYCNRYKPRTLIGEYIRSTLCAAFQANQDCFLFTAQKGKEPTAAQKTTAGAGSNSTPGTNGGWANTTALFQNLKAPTGGKNTPAPTGSIFGAQQSSAAKGAANGQSPVPSIFAVAPTNKSPAPSSAASPSLFFPAAKSGTTPSPGSGGLFGNAGFGRPPDGTPSRTPESAAKAPAVSGGLFGSAARSRTPEPSAKHPAPSSGFGSSSFFGGAKA